MVGGVGAGATAGAHGRSACMLTGKQAMAGSDGVCGITSAAPNATGPAHQRQKASNDRIGWCVRHQHRRLSSTQCLKACMPYTILSCNVKMRWWVASAKAPRLTSTQIP
eukprot:1138421-Pelagomonas_calceolata.AAC.3